MLEKELEAIENKVKEKSLKAAQNPGQIWYVEIEYEGPDLKEDTSFNIYFQDKYADQKVPNREYFFNILNTIHPQYLNQIMTHASE